MARLSTLAVLALCALPVEGQQDWGTSGTWTQLMPSNLGPQGRAWHHATTLQGSLYIVGGSATDVGNATYFYYPVANTWTQYPDLPATFAAPDIVAAGGYLNLFGGDGGGFGFSNTLLAISTTNPAAGWFQFILPNSPPTRNGHRLISFGGIMYLTGGWNPTIDYYNDVWALDVNGFFNGSVTGWTSITSNGTVGLPPPRNTFSWDNMGYDAVMFGGFWHNIAGGGAYTDCTVQAQCRYYNDLWIYRPAPVGLAGLQPNPLAIGWIQVTVSGSTVPQGRTGHASGILSDQLFIFGGQGASGWLSDVWVFNFKSHAWAQVSSSGASPGAVSYPTGAFIGSHYFFISSSGTPGSNLWRFDTVPSSGGPGSTTNNNSWMSTAGLGAGIAIGVLINVASLVVIVLVWRKGRAGGIGGGRGLNDDRAGDLYGQLA